MIAAYAAVCGDLSRVQAQWAEAADKGLAAFNAVLARGFDEQRALFGFELLTVDFDFDQISH